MNVHCALFMLLFFPHCLVFIVQTQCCSCSMTLCWCRLSTFPFISFFSPKLPWSYQQRCVLFTLCFNIKMKFFLCGSLNGPFAFHCPPWQLGFLVLSSWINIKQTEVIQPVASRSSTVSALPLSELANQFPELLHLRFVQWHHEWVW